MGNNRDALFVLWETKSILSVKYLNFGYRVERNVCSANLGLREKSKQNNTITITIISSTLYCNKYQRLDWRYIDII